jgi:hypothetical protein
MVTGAYNIPFGEFGPVLFSLAVAPVLLPIITMVAI